MEEGYRRWGCRRSSLSSRKVRVCAQSGGRSAGLAGSDGAYARSRLEREVRFIELKNSSISYRQFGIPVTTERRALSTDHAYPHKKPTMMYVHSWGWEHVLTYRKEQLGGTNSWCIVACALFSLPEQREGR